MYWCCVGVSTDKCWPLNTYRSLIKQIKRHLMGLFLSFFQVLGNAKGAVAVVISILIFQNPVSMIGMLGYVLTIIGVILYSETKKRFT